MQVETLEMERDAAFKAWKKYQTHKHYQTPIDAEIERIYAAIAKGKMVIRALESIRVAGVGQDGYPKLAIARADAKQCFLDLGSDGSATMTDVRWPRGNTAADRLFRFEPGSFPLPTRGKWSASAIVPHVPPEHRPARTKNMVGYHILWEALWTKEPPRDPMLLKRFGKGDTWVVCAAWDLTDVERAVMADRLRAQRRN